MESLRAVVKFAFEDCRFHKLKATVTTGNEASCTLLKKAGFKEEGVLREHDKLGGVWRDDRLFGLLSHERHEQ